MLTRAHKLALAAGAFAGGLFSAITLGNAGDALLDAARIGAIDGIALDDGQMSELRGTGLFGSAFQAFLNSLPPGNTVEVQIGDTTPVRRPETGTTTGTVSLNCSSAGVSCGAGTSFSLKASSPASAHVSVSQTLP